jgi:putative ABC transport system permease protein
LICGIDTPDEGTVEVGGVDLTHLSERGKDYFRNRCFGFDFQMANLIGHLSAWQNIAIPLLAGGVKKRDITSMVNTAIKTVGLNPGIVENDVFRLSGGEIQRVLAARAIVNNPQIILADESASMLDDASRTNIVELYKTLSKNKLVIFVAHNMNFVGKYADRIITMDGGKIVGDQTLSMPQEAAVQNQVNISQYFAQAEVKRGRMKLGAIAGVVRNNLATRRFVNWLVAGVSSIGIASLALVLAISNGFSAQVAQLRDFTMRTQPISINASFEGVNENIIDENVIAMADEFVGNTDINFIWKKKSMDMHPMTEDAFLPESIAFQPMPRNTITSKYYKTVSGRLPYETAYGAKEIVLVLDASGRIPRETATLFGVSPRAEITYDLFQTKYDANKIEIVPNNKYYSEYEYNSALYDVRNASHLLHTYNTNAAGHKRLDLVGIIQPKTSVNILAPGFAYNDELYLERQAVEATSDIYVSQVGEFATTSTSNVLARGDALETKAEQDAWLKRLGGKNGASEIMFYVNNERGKDAVLAALANYNENADPEYKLKFVDMISEVSKDIKTVDNSLVVVLGAVALIALLASVFLIGGMFYNSVRERVKELGMLRAVGMKRSDILLIMIIEAVCVSVLAGVIGILLNLIFCLILQAILGTLAGMIGSVVLVVGWQVLALLGGALVIGVVAGLPASLSAANKDPIEAFRIGNSQ